MVKRQRQIPKFQFNSVKNKFNSMKDITLYPLKFYPMIKDKIWGGDKLKVQLGKEGGVHSGESWEISGVAENQSTVSNGALKGKRLNELIDGYKEKFLGTSVYKKFGNEFPLLIKFIDAKQDLSIQVHPSDEQSNGFGKTEMWYIMDADPNAYLLSGFNKKVRKKELRKAIVKGNFEDYMNKVPVKSGDTFFIEANHVHSIGTGVMLAEIQQTSDITYRIYDFNRKDQAGNLRELHIEDAFEVMNLGLGNGQVEYINTNKVQLVSVPEFTTSKFKLEDHTSIKIKAPLEHFLIVIAVGGKGVMAYEDKVESFHMGDTIFVPPGIEVEIISSSGFEFLETYID